MVKIFKIGITSVLALSISMVPCFASSKTELLPESKKIIEAFKKIKKSNKKSQNIFLSVFPKTGKKFIRIFNPPKFDQLYSESFKYIEVLFDIGQKEPKKVILFLLNLAADIKNWDADGVGFLQNTLTKMAANKVNEFVSSI